jgi:hypothetical protein
MPISNLPNSQLAPQMAAPGLPMGGGGAAKTLPMQVPRQKGSNTCWAAVAASVSRYKNAASPWTECRVISAVVPTAVGCCNSGPYPDACDKDNGLQLALNATGNYVDAYPRTEPEAVILDQLRQNNPVGIAIRWPPAANNEIKYHFAVIIGIDLSDPDDAMVLVGDPLLDKPWSGDFDALFGAYRGGAAGTWMATYLTK